MLKVDDTALVLVDFQGKLADVVDRSEDVLTKLVSLIKGVQLLGIPIIWLEQYPQGLGPTKEAIKQLLEEDNEPIAKMEFSGCSHDAFKDKLNELDRDTFLVAGIEAHICVYQTVRELLALEKDVEFVQDGISSRTEESKQIAVEKMMLLGALPTSVEMALFELMKTAEHPNFREISKLIK